MWRKNTVGRWHRRRCAAMLWPIRFQCVWVWISAGLPCVYVHRLQTWEKFVLRRIFWKVTIAYLAQCLWCYYLWFMLLFMIYVTIYDSCNDVVSSCLYSMVCDYDQWLSRKCVQLPDHNSIWPTSPRNFLQELGKSTDLFRSSGHIFNRRTSE